MPTGTYSISIPGAYQNNYSSGGYTYALAGAFNQDVRLKSVSFYAASDTAGAQAKIVVYNAGNSAKVYDSGVLTFNTTTGGLVELALPTPFLIPYGSGGYYYIGIYNVSGFNMGYETGQAGTVYSSSPSSSITFNTSGTTGGFGGSGDAIPTTNLSTYQFINKLSFDFPLPDAIISSPNATTIDNLAAVNFTWTKTGGAQASYEIGYRKKGINPSWTVATNTTTTQSHTFAADTFEDGVLYDWYVVLKGADGAAGAVATSTFTNTSWTNLSEVTSSAATGVLDATSFVVGTYDVGVRVADASGRYGAWSPLTTFAFSPASNVYAKVAGTMKQSINYVRVAGVWKQVPPTKKNTSGTFN